MKKSILFAGLINIFCSGAFAQNIEKPASLSNQSHTLKERPGNKALAHQTLASQTTSSTTSVQTTAPITTTQDPNVAPAVTTHTITTTTPVTPQPEVTVTTQPQPVTLQPVDPAATTTTIQTNPQVNTVPTQTVPSSTQVITTPVEIKSQTVKQPITIQKSQTTSSINCNYHIPAETAKIEPQLVLKWAEKATTQSFEFHYNTLKEQLTALKTCYTDPGWVGFNEALQKSGNLNAIQTQQLEVNSMVTAPGQIMEIKDNQWKVSLPLQVVYQNEKEKLIQPLTVNLIVGRKVSGDLGIMQMIAIPRTTSTSSVSTTTIKDTNPVTTNPTVIEVEPKQP